MFRLHMDSYEQHRCSIGTPYAPVSLLFRNSWVLQKVLKDSGYFLWVTLTPAILCLVSLLIVMSLLRWSSTSFEGEMSATFALLQRCLMLGLNRLDIGGKNVTVDTSEYLQLRSQLLQRSINLNETYSQAAFELRIGRLSCEFVFHLVYLTHVNETPSEIYSPVHWHCGTSAARTCLGHARRATES